MRLAHATPPMYELDASAYLSLAVTGKLLIYALNLVRPYLYAGASRIPNHVEVNAGTEKKRDKLHRAASTFNIDADAMSSNRAPLKLRGIA